MSPKLRCSLFNVESGLSQLGLLSATRAHFGLPTNYQRPLGPCLPVPGVCSGFPACSQRSLQSCFFPFYYNERLLTWLILSILIKPPVYWHSKRIITNINLLVHRLHLLSYGKKKLPKFPKFYLIFRIWHEHNIIVLRMWNYCISSLKYLWLPLNLYLKIMLSFKTNSSLYLSENILT